MFVSLIECEKFIYNIDHCDNTIKSISTRVTNFIYNNCNHLPSKILYIKHSVKFSEHVILIYENVELKITNNSVVLDGKIYTFYENLYNAIECKFPKKCTCNIETLMLKGCECK